MRNKWLKRFFPLLAFLLLAPWPVAYAHSYTGEPAGQELIQLEAAPLSASPTWTVFGRTIGGVTAGDLFYIDATEQAADIQVNLYLTNSVDLARHYRYLLLKVGVYFQDGAGEWHKASLDNGEPVPDTFITLLDSQVSFTLPGSANYKVTIDGGSFYCFSTNADVAQLSPQFYLTAD